ncbi:MAG: alpha-mannosidase, partial [Ardenticatenaceae bacterium]
MLFFTVQKIARLLPEIRAAIYREIHPITHFKFAEGEQQGAHRPDFDDEAWEDFTVGDFWGGYDVVAWFRTTVQVPEQLRDKKLALRFLGGPRDDGGSTAEMLLYVNGEPLQGIDVWHEEAWLPLETVEQGEISIALHAWSGVLDVPDRRRFKLAALLWIDEATEEFYYLAHTLLEAVKVLDEDDLRRVHLLERLNAAFGRIKFTRPHSDEFYASMAEGGNYLRDALAAMERLEELKPQITAVGHAHIDMAWLWRLSHTREKAARTFSTVLHLMRQYPEYRFVHSTPQLYT